jgi:hypothetical protein
LDKHIHFLKGQLNAQDEQARGNALAALAAYDATPQIERLQAALHSSSERLQSIGLEHLRGHATPEILNEVKALIIEKQPIAENDGGVDANRLMIESAGLELLLVSGDADMRKFAIERMQSTLAAKDLPLIRWGVLVDLAGDQELRQLIPLIQSTATNEEMKLMALPTLVKLGDADAINRLQSLIESDTSSEGRWWILVHDQKAIQAAQIDRKHLRAVISKHSFDRPADRDLLLAYLGNTDDLLKRLRLYERNDVPRSHDEEMEILKVLTSVGEVGDGQFLKVLDDLFDKLPNNDEKIACSKAILQIIARQRATKERGHNLGK